LVAKNWSLNSFFSCSVLTWYTCQKKSTNLWSLVFLQVGSKVWLPSNTIESWG